VVFRSLGPHHGFNDPEEISEITEELGFILTSLEAEWGMATGTRMSVWSMTEPSLDFVAQLSESCGMDVDVQSLETLPSLSEGMARRSARKGVEKLNLAPTDWLEREKSRKVKRTLLLLTVVFMVLWLSVSGTLFGLFSMQEKRYRQLQVKTEELNAEARQVRTMKEKVQSLTEYADRSRSALETLREITALLPQGIDLSSFTYRKGARVTLRGEARSEAPIYTYIEALEKSEMFTQVKTEGIASKRRKNQTITEFKVSCELPGGGEEE
jgi:Tfp pilus assembly protein PilN